MHVRQPDLAREPFRERVQGQQLLGVTRVLEFLFGDDRQRMLVVAVMAALIGQLVAVRLRDQLVGDQVGQYPIERQGAGFSGGDGGGGLNRFRCAFGHDREYNRIP